MLESLPSFLFASWERTFFLTFIFFSFIYFTSALLAQLLARYFSKNEVGNSINPKPSHQQIFKEIRLSLVSIFIFSLQAIGIQWAYTKGIIHIEWNIIWYTLPFEILALFLWNEIHFYAAHWLLHRKWLFKKVHFIHHRSTSPTPFSTYSFHWFEAFLLGTVIFLPLLVYNFQFLALISLPLLSIFLNVLGHWNYDMFPEKSSSHILKFSFRHSMHHKWIKGNFGFFLPQFDHWFKTKLSDDKQ